MGKAALQWLVALGAGMLGPIGDFIASFPPLGLEGTPEYLVSAAFLALVYRLIGALGNKFGRRPAE